MNAHCDAVHPSVAFICVYLLPVRQANRPSFAIQESRKRPAMLS
jgi:hypothetical protein